MHPHRLATPAGINTFMFAGNATLTIKSLKTGTHFTYKVKVSDDGKKHWVKVLTQGDNEEGYTYLGYWTGQTYYHGRKSPIGEDAPSSRAYKFLCDQLGKDQVHPQLEVWHEGKCGACGRKLTVPESIERGIGPDCAERLGIA